MDSVLVEMPTSSRGGTVPFSGRTRWGVGTWSPLATAETIVAIWIGVTARKPWPMATEMVSPGYQRSRWACCFQACEGRMPGSSPGTSMPVRAPRPRIAPYSWIVSIPSFWPSS